MLNNLLATVILCKLENNYPFIPPLRLSNKMAKVLVAVRGGLSYKF